LAEQAIGELGKLEVIDGSLASSFGNTLLKYPNLKEVNDWWSRDMPAFSIPQLGVMIGRVNAKRYETTEVPIPDYRPNATVNNDRTVSRNGS
jgi:hypothetical protein